MSADEPTVRYRYRRAHSHLSRLCVIEFHRPKHAERNAPEEMILDEPGKVVNLPERYAEILAQGRAPRTIGRKD